MHRFEIKQMYFLDLTGWVALQNLGKTENSIQWCAQFVAHRCQESTLGAIGDIGPHTDIG